MRYQYTPDADSWLAFVIDDRALLVGNVLEHDLVTVVWERLAEGAPALLEVLTARGLQATPPFALVEPAVEGVRVIVRGGATVTIGGESIGGSGAATWIERVLPEGPIEIRVARAEVAAVTLPLVNGVAHASGIRSIHSSSPVTSAPPQAVVTPRAPEASTGASSSSVTPPTKGEISSGEASENTILHETTVAEVDARTSFEPPPEPPVEAAVAAGPVDASGYDYLFGATMFRSVKDAAVEAEPAEDETRVEPPSIAIDDALGDHDGETMFVSKLDRPRGRSKRADDALAAPPQEQETPLVVLPTGAKQDLDIPLILGRAPSVSGVPAGDLPRLVPLSGGDQDLSRNHVRIEVQGGTVVVTDLHSKNGTTIALPGSSPVRLRGGEPTPVIAGTAIELGGVVTVTIEDAI